MKLSIMYRGPLTSCNYGCYYCPFSKRSESDARLQRDKDSLRRFVEWIASQDGIRWRLLFTPWGEALVRTWYRNALVELSHCSYVDSVAAQTNLSCSIDWVKQCDLERVAFWATYHPTEARRDGFVGKVIQLRSWGVRLSVGMVAAPESLDHLAPLRAALPSDVYLWLNPQSPRKRRYTDDETKLFTEIDPLFPMALRRLRTRGKPCRTGEVAFTVDGEGDMRRCHFVDEVIGNIYKADWKETLQPRNCPNQFCDCYLGVAQQQADDLASIFGDELMERVAAMGRPTAERFQGNHIWLGLGGEGATVGVIEAESLPSQ